MLGSFAVLLFQTGWFVESLMTQTLIIHIIRTNKIPFIQSMPSVPLILTSGIIMAVGMWLPYSGLARPLGFTELPITVLAYFASHTSVLHYTDPGC